MDSSKSSPLLANPNPNPNKPMMAFHFTSALANINTTSSSSSSSSSLRCRRISCAAYASMAVAAGPGRAWSRALLRRLRGRAKARRISIRFPGRRSTTRAPSTTTSSSRLGSLRSLVPGGGDMDLCRLLEESASYVHCLATQVTLMRSIVDSYDNNNM